MMYDELVKSLRICADGERCNKCGKWEVKQAGGRNACEYAICTEAADAIEELSKKYLTSETDNTNLTGWLAEEYAKPRWVPVSERLPEHQDEYLVLWRQKDPATGRLFYEILEYEGNGHWVDDIPQAEPFGGFQVLYWMPLPGLPEEET